LLSQASYLLKTVSRIQQSSLRQHWQQVMSWFSHSNGNISFCTWPAVRQDFHLVHI